MANTNQQNSGEFRDTMGLAMAKLKYGITRIQRGTQQTHDGRVKTAFVALNAKGQEVCRGLIADAIAGEAKIPANAQLSMVDYVRQSDGKPSTVFMIHRAASNLELSDWEEE